MLTNNDIKKIIEAQKDVFYTKDELDENFYSKKELDSKFTKLQTPIDAIAKDNLDKSQEIPTINHRVKDIENWVDKAAPKVGIKFNH